MKDPPAAPAPVSGSENGSIKPKLTPDQIGAILEKHGITFHGPPLE